jgi:hypothetical protein
VERRLLPVACTLEPSAVSDRLTAWRRLAGHLQWSRLDGGRLEAEFAAGSEPELQRLVDAERTCCAWAEWAVAGSTLVVTGPADGVGALAGALLGAP